MIKQIEAADKKMRESGQAADWFAVADAAVRGVTDDANGEIFKQLEKLANFVDDGAVPQLREGGKRRQFVEMCLRLSRRY